METRYLTEQEIARRLRRYRIDAALTQQELAKRSGVSVRSISRFENGEGIQFGNFIKLLIALGLGVNLDLLVPDPAARPSYQLRIAELRQRVSAQQKVREPELWTWGDEE